jgi:hypothetical protein
VSSSTRSGGDQPGDAGGEGRGLAGPGAGDDQQVAAVVLDGALLGVGQSAGEHVYETR